MHTITEAKHRAQVYRYAIENPSTINQPVEKLDGPDRWAFPNFHEALGLPPSLRTMPNPDSPEGKNAARVASLIQPHYVRLTQATIEEAVVNARSLSDKLYCHCLHKPHFKFMHQEGDRFDPGYRMTVALPAMMAALFDACGHEHGVDIVCLAAMGNDLTDFHATWSVKADVRFLPVKRLAQFLQAFVGVVRPA